MNINKNWLKDEEDNLLAPRTLTSCIQDENGNAFQDYADNMVIMSPEETTEVPDNLTSYISNQDMYNIVSDAYDSTKTYAVGDYCIYNNVAYKCNTAITTAEEFDSAKWTATRIGTEVSELNNKLLNYIIEEGIIEDTGAHYRKYANGVIEVWGYYSAEPIYQTSNQSSSTSGIYWSDAIFIPVGINFVSIQELGTNAYSGGIVWTARPSYNSVDNQLVTYVMQVGSSTRQTYIHYHLRGTWK